MARWPGTETPANASGFAPGGAVRCRPTAAHHQMGLANRCGVVAEVRFHHVRVLLEASGRSVWLASGAVEAAEQVGDPRLELLAAALSALGGHRLEVEEGRVIVFTTGCPDVALDALRARLGPRLVSWEVCPEGVHELSVRLELLLGGS